MWFAMSLITIALWGAGDLFTKMGSKPDDRTSHLRMVIAVGLAMGVSGFIFLLTSGIEYAPINIIRYFPVSLMYILSMTLGYAGLRYIELSVSSPVCNSSGGVALILCAVFLGQRVTSLQTVALVLIVGGMVALAALEKRGAPVLTEDRKYRVGAIAFIFPLLYCVIDGLGTFMDAYYLTYVMDEDVANLSYQFTFLIAAVLSWLYLRFVRKQRFVLRQQGSFWLAALCETFGQYSYVYAMGDNAIVAAPMIASYSIVSVLLSRLFLKEKLSKWQYITIAAVMIGIAILGFEDA